MDCIIRVIHNLEDAWKYIQSQVATTKTAFRIHHKNEKQLWTALKDALDGHSYFQRSKKLLSQEC